MKISDRLFGLVAILGALGFALSALNIPTGFMSDPVGSKTFPLIISAVIAVCGAVMILRPDGDPQWPDMNRAGALVLCVIVLVGYAYALKPMGFLVPTALAAGVLSYQISGKAQFALLTGPGLALGLFVIFRFGLGLSLFAFPRWLMG